VGPRAGLDRITECLKHSSISHILKIEDGQYVKQTLNYKAKGRRDLGRSLKICTDKLHPFVAGPN
jgi:hypothetical protein